MNTTATPERIRTFNADRDPALVAGKFAAMRESVFRFYRGTSHLFNEDIPADSFIWQAPPTWNVGDLHIENFGSFKGDNRVAYFDLNDFDECILAPNLADLARLSCSLFVAADFLKLNDAESRQLVRVLTDAYATTLAAGYIRPLEQETATGIVGQFLRSVTERKRRFFVESHVKRSKHKVRFRAITGRINKASKTTKQRIRQLIHTWAQTQPTPDFFNVLDVAHRVAGTGSLGVDRFTILISGTGKPGKEYVLDLKQSGPSTLQPRLAAQQPHWLSYAERIVEVQKRVQAASPALLHPLTTPDGTSYVLRELQPIEDKIALTGLAGRPKKLTQLVGTMGQLCAWGHLRSGGRQGSSIADTLIGFGDDYPTWQPALQEYAYQYAGQVRTDYDTYCHAYDAGYFREKS